jgi:hypothetical protein
MTESEGLPQNDKRQRAPQDDSKGEPGGYEGLSLIGSSRGAKPLLYTALSPSPYEGEGDYGGEVICIPTSTNFLSATYFPSTNFLHGGCTKWLLICVDISIQVI